MAFNPITVNKGPSAEPHIYAEDDASIFQCMFGEDGILDIGSKLELSIQSNNLVRMSDGVLCIGGHIGRVKYADYVDLTIDNGETGYNRNDLIIGSFSNTGEHTIDTFEPQVVKGTPATGDAVDPTLTEGSLYEGEHLRQAAVARVRLEGLNIVGIDMLLPVIPSIPSLKAQIDELNGNTYKSVEVPPGAQYKKYTIGNTTVVIGTLLAISPNDYVKIFSIQNLKDFFGEDVELSRISLTTWNGHANAAPVHFYAPELWDNDGVYQYFYPAHSGDVRVNYRAEYTR